MSVKIRLSKVGRTHQISYRIGAQETRTKRDGKFLEILGYYNPYNTPQLKIEKERFDFWLKSGAKPTPAVESLLKEGKLTKRPSKRKLAQKAKAAEEKAQKAEAAKAAQAAPPTPEPTVETPQTENQETTQTEVQAEPKVSKEESVSDALSEQSKEPDQKPV